MEDFIYAAGLFDGEGTITLSKRSKSSTFRLPSLSLTSTTYALVLFMKTVFGGCIRNHTKKSDRHSQAWSWQLTSDKAIKALSLIRPYLREPEKCRRADLILMAYKDVTIRNGKYSDSQRLAKQEFELLFFHPSTPCKPSKVPISL